MAIREITASGIDALNLATELLQRGRLADPLAGIWEAADVQWSWRTPRDSDRVEKVFWIDDDGPVAGIWLTGSAERSWQIDPIITTQATGIPPETVWNRAMEIIAANPDTDFELPIADTDLVLQKLAQEAGLIATDQDFTGWLEAQNVREPSKVADDFQLVDRTMRENATHPMSDRSGDYIAERLQQCSLYDPSLDLSMEAYDGEVAGYSLYWFDHVTRVGLVEPVRVHDDFQRKGLAMAMVTNGINRLISKGARRIKVSWETEAAGALYLGIGFQKQSTTTWYSTAPRERTTE